MDYAKYEPKLDNMFQTALRQGKEALETVYKSPEWRNFKEGYTAVVIKDLQLENIELKDLHIHGVIMDKAQFHDVQFTNVSLAGSDAWEATFQNCIFDRCPAADQGESPIETDYVDVRNSTWTNITFRDMSLRYWLLNGGSFKNIRTQNVELPITQSEIIHLLKSLKFDEFHKRRYEQAPETDELDLTHTDLSGIDFHGCHFEYIDTRFANLQHTSFAGEDLFVNDFSGSDMRGADLSNCHSTSNFYDTDLRGAKLHNFVAQKENWTTSHMYGAKFAPGAENSIIGNKEEIFKQPTRDWRSTPPNLPAWNGFNA